MEAAGESVAVPVPVVEGAPVAPIEDSITSIEEALERLCRAANAENGIAIGTNCAIKALEGKKPFVCLLADDADEPIKELVTLVAQDKNVPVVAVESKSKLGFYAGLCQMDSEGQPRKVRDCATVVVYECGFHDPAFLKKHIAATRAAATQKA